MIAIMVGGYLCLSNIGLLRGNCAAAFYRDLSERPGVLHAVGAVAFFVGCGVLAVRGFELSPLDVLIAIAAALWIFEGAGMLAQPQLLASILANPDTPGKLRPLMCFQVLLGLAILALALAG